MFVVLQLHKTITVEALGIEQEVPLAIATGMIGGLPVFDTRKHAEAFSEGKFLIEELQTTEPEQLSQ